MINNLDVITRDVIEEYAKKNTVCPFELCLDLSYWMDGIICDYNYVFDPEVKLKRFFRRAARANIFFLWMKPIIWWTGQGTCIRHRFIKKMCFP